MKTEPITSDMFLHFTQQTVRDLYSDFMKLLDISTLAYYALEMIILHEDMGIPQYHADDRFVYHFAQLASEFMKDFDSIIKHSCDNILCIDPMRFEGITIFSSDEHFNVIIDSLKKNNNYKIRTER